MQEPRTEQEAGTVIRGADGALYFIPEEIMQACKVTEPECLEACTQVLDGEGEVEGYVLARSPVVASVNVRSQIAAPSGSPIRFRLGNAASTTMSPWTFGKSPGGVISKPGGGL